MASDNQVHITTPDKAIWREHARRRGVPLSSLVKLLMARDIDEWDASHRQDPGDTPGGQK